MLQASERQELTFSAFAFLRQHCILLLFNISVMYSLVMVYRSFVHIEMRCTGMHIYVLGRHWKGHIWSVLDRACYGAWDLVFSV